MIIIMMTRCETRTDREGMFLSLSCKSRLFVREDAAAGDTEWVTGGDGGSDAFVPPLVHQKLQRQTSRAETGHTSACESVGEGAGIC